MRHSQVASLANIDIARLGWHSKNCAQEILNFLRAGRCIIKFKTWKLVLTDLAMHRQKIL